jgi:N-acetyltransferase
MQHLSQTQHISRQLSHCNMENIFDDAPRRKSIKRTYSLRKILEECSTNETGLVTPPPSSSPCSSPTIPRQEMTIVPATRDPVVRSSEALFGSRARTKSKIHKTTHAKTIKKDLVQMQLNLLPARVTCKECGMSYTRTSPADVNMHAEFHKAHLYGLVVPPSVSNKNSNIKACDAPIETIRLASAKTSETAFVKRVCEMVDLELNSTLPPLNDGYTAYVSVFNGRCIAFLLVQSISTSYPLLNGELDRDRPMSSVIGVSRMWTCKTYRRQGLMRRLLEHARTRFVYGSHCSTKELCFTQLSESGEGFLKHYLPQGEPVLMYSD